MDLTRRPSFIYVPLPRHQSPHQFLNNRYHTAARSGSDQDFYRAAANTTGSQIMAMGMGIGCVFCVLLYLAVGVYLVNVKLL